MHELGLLTSVVEAVERAAAEATSKVSRVENVALKVGTLSGAVPEALQGSWPLAKAGTICEDARLTLEVIPATVFCPTCNRDVEIDEFFALTCPECGTPTGNMTHGRECALDYVEWSTEDSP